MVMDSHFAIITTLCLSVSVVNWFFSSLLKNDLISISPMDRIPSPRPVC